MKKRCAWAENDPLYQKYHDEEWGVPVHDDKKLFEMLVLESAQAGLNWITILRKRENYRLAFDNLLPEKIAKYDEEKINQLLNNPGIIRNKLKILSAIQNAKSFLEIKNKYGSFDNYIWRFIDYTPRINKWKSLKEIPTKTKESDIMSKDLKKNGFTFVGSTICYSFMQAVGMVNDHLINCFRYDQISNTRKIK